MQPARKLTPAALDDHAATTRNALTRNVGIDMATRAGYLVTRVFVPPFVVAHIGLDGYSLWAAIFVMFSYAGATTVGIAAVYGKYVAEYVARGENEKANQLLSTGLLTVSAVCAAVFLLLLLGLTYVLGFLRIPPELTRAAPLVVLIVAGTFLSDIAFSVFNMALSGAQKIAEVQIIWVVTYVVETFLIFYLVGTGRGIMGLAEAYLVREVVSIVLYIVAAYYWLPWLRISPRLCSRGALHQLVSYGGIVQLVAVLSMALNTIERVVAVPLIGLSAVGLLDLSDKLPTMATTIPTAFASSFLPAAAYLEGGMTGTARGRETIAKLYLKGGRYLNLVAGSFAGLLATAAGPLMAVWMGEVFPGTVLLMAIFAVQQHLHVMTGPGTSILKGLGRPREELYYVVPNCLLVLVAIPLSRLVFGGWTTVGLGTAVAVATMVSAAGFIHHANRELEIPWRRYLRYVAAPGVIPYLVGLLFVLPSHYVLHLGRFEGLAVMGLVGLAYAAALLLVIDRGVLETDERYWFRAVISNELVRLSHLIRGGASQ